MNYPFKPEIITSKFIEDFINTNESETTLFDFKLELPTKHASERREFLRDVVSFLNSMGGMIIFGVANNRDIVGIENHTDLDDIKKPWNQLLLQGIAPHISGIVIKEVFVESKRLIVISIPEGDSKPYCVNFPNDSSMDFYNRHDGIKHPMKYSEVKKMMMGLSASDEDFWLKWLHLKIDETKKNQWHEKLKKDPFFLLVFHPVKSKPQDSIFSPLDITKAAAKTNTLRAPHVNTWTVIDNPTGAHCLGRIVLHGQGPEDECFSYAEAMSNGAIVFFDSYPLSFYLKSGMQQDFDTYLIDYYDRAISLMHELGADNVEYNFTFIINGAKGLKIKPLIPFPYGSTSLAKGVPVEAFTLKSNNFKISEKKDKYEILKPMLDTLWRASGFPKCARYNDEGKFIGGNRHEEI